MASFWNRLEGLQAILFIVLVSLILFALNMIVGHYASNHQISHLYSGTIGIPENNFESIKLALDSKIMASSIIVDLMTIIFIIACSLFLIRVWIVCSGYFIGIQNDQYAKQNNKFPRNTINIVAIIAIIFIISNFYISIRPNVYSFLGRNTGTFLSIAHNYPEKLILNYCNIQFIKKENEKSNDNKIVKFKISALIDQNNNTEKTCEILTTLPVLIFVISAVLGILVVGAILFISGVSLTPLDRYTAKVLSADLAVKMPRRRSRGSPESDADDYINKLTIEFRKRTDELQDIFGFGAVLLFITIGWMAVRVKWAAPLIVEMHGQAALSVLNSYIVYLAVTYSAVLFLSYAPQMFLLHKQFRDRYYDTAVGVKKSNAEAKNERIIGFTDWLDKNHLSSNVLTARDLIPMLVPLISLLLTGALELSSIRELAAGLR